jgi:hypothetical protein
MAARRIVEALGIRTLEARPGVFAPFVFIVAKLRL